MPNEFVAATGENIEYKAYVRHFENPEETDEPSRVSVLYVIATLTKPDSGWTFMLAQQEGEPDTWRFLEDAPGYRDNNRTYYIASGTSEMPLDAVLRSIAVITETGTTRVAVAPWD